MGTVFLNNVLRTFFVKLANLRFKIRTGIWDAILMLIIILDNDCPGAELAISIQMFLSHVVLVIMVRIGEHQRL